MKRTKNNKRNGSAWKYQKGASGNLSSYQKLKAKQATCKHKFTVDGVKHTHCVKCGKPSVAHLRSLNKR